MGVWAESAVDWRRWAVPWIALRCIQATGYRHGITKARGLYGIYVRSPLETGGRKIFGGRSITTAPRESIDCEHQAQITLQ